MNFDRIVVAFFAFILLAGGYYYFDIVGENKKKENAATLNKIIDLLPEDVVAVSIKRPDKETIELAKKGSDWRIVKPIKTLADQMVVKYAISAAMRLSSVTDIADGNLATFGLDDPTTYIFTMKNKEQVSLNIGAKNPSGANYYVYVGADSSVRMVGRVSVTPLIKNIFELRDKRLLPMTSKEIDSITIAISGKEKILLETQEDGEWNILQPVNAPARRSVVNDFVDAMTGAIVSGFAEQSDEPLGKYGLAPPVAEVTFRTTGEDSLSSKVFFGAKTPGGSRYAKSDLHDTVTRVPAELFDTAPLSLNKLRDLGLISFAVEEISKVKVERKTDPLTVISKIIDGENKWSIAQPIGFATDPYTATSAIYELSIAKALSVVAERGDLAKYNIDNPTIVITVIGPDNKTEKLFASPSIIKPNFWLIKKEGDPAIYEIDEAGINSVAPQLFRFIDRRIFGDTKPENVSRIVIKRMGQTFDIKKTGEKYRLLSPENLEISPSVFNRLIWRLTALRYEYKLEQPEIKGEPPDFNTPLVSVMIYNSRGEKSIDVLFAATDEKKKRYFAKFSGDITLHQVNAGFIKTDIIDALEALLVPNG